MEIPLLREIVTIFGLSILVILTCYRFKIPAIVGFLITGVLAGPHGLGFVNNVEDVDTLATIGIVLLLFTVGMEFSLKKIMEYRRFFLNGGGLQVLFTVLAGFLVGILLNRPLGESLFLGFLLSLSSTAITLRVLDEKSESDTPHGRLIVGILIFQDIVAIPMMLLTPLLGGEVTQFDSEIVIKAVIGIVFLIVTIIAALKIVPQILYQIAKTRSRELFLLTVLTICFSVAWLTSSIGLSLSLGAFLAGLIISESEYRHEAISDILPFQDVFTSFFFVSIGMLLDVNFVLSQPLTILFITLGVLILKAVFAGSTAIFLGMPLRTGILTGIGLCQIGEFSFVLAKNGASYGLTDDYRYQLFLAVSLFTMGLTPTLIALGSTISDWILKLPLPNSLKTGFKPNNLSVKTPLNDHIVIVGFGLSGRNLAMSAKKANIPYVVIEMNPETVKYEKLKGEPIYFGDASHKMVLSHASIENAAAVAILINDFTASKRIVEVLRLLNPKLYIVVRTRYFEQIHSMYQLGADEVIPDELGSSVEVLTQILSHLEISSNEIESIASQVRIASYEKLRKLYQSSSTIYDLKLKNISANFENLRESPEIKN